MNSIGMRRKRGRPRRDEPREINDFDLALIKEVRKRPPLYDRQHPQYRNREYAQPQWLEIARNLRSNVTAVKNRMLQLRSRYSLEKRRMESLQEQDGDTNTNSQWILYDSLSFLNDHIQSRRSFVALNTKKSPVSSNSSEVCVDFEDSSEFVNGNSTTAASEHHLLSPRKYERGASNSPVDVGAAVNSVALDNVQSTNTSVAHNKYTAFGQFLGASLIEMNEKQALRLVEKFTADVCKALQPE